MITDNDTEAPAARRLVAFGATFLGLLTLSNAAFPVTGPILAPPLVALVAILGAVGGLLIWVNSAYSRAAYWLAAGIVLVAAADAAIIRQPEPWLAVALVTLALLALAGASFTALPLLGLGGGWAWARHARWLVILPGLLLALATAPVGLGPIVAIVAAGALLAIIFLLRPLPPEPDQQD